MKHQTSNFDNSCVSTYAKGRKSDRLFVILPGPLARGDEQVEPIADTFKKYGDLLSISYSGHHWDMGAVAREVANRIEERVECSEVKTVTIVGLSLGAYVALHVLQSMWVDLRRNVNLIVVDAPFGIDTLYRLKDAPFAKYVIRHAGYSWPIGPLICKMSQVRPKVQNIALPLDNSEGQEQYIRNIRRQADSNLKDHSWRLYMSQLAYMMENNPPVELLEKYGTVTVYISCESRKNDTIVQPTAYQRWKERYPNLHSYNVGTAHAAFLEDPEPWRYTFEMVISKEL